MTSSEVLNGAETSPDASSDHGLGSGEPMVGEHVDGTCLEDSVAVKHDDAPADADIWEWYAQTSPI